LLPVRETMPRRPHAVWEYFEVVAPRRTPGKSLPDVRCSLCGANIRNARVSKDLLPHVAACALSPECAKRLNLTTKQTGTSAKQKSSTKGTVGMKERALNLEERELYAKLAEGMEEEGTPFSAVERARFKRLFKYLFPDLRTPRGHELATCGASSTDATVETP